MSLLSPAGGSQQAIPPRSVCITAFFTQTNTMSCPSKLIIPCISGTLNQPPPQNAVASKPRNMYESANAQRSARIYSPTKREACTVSSVNRPLSPHQILGYCEDSLTAIRMQHKLTYGLRRSPTRANFQNIPKTLRLSALAEAVRSCGRGWIRVHPSLLRSMMPGATACT